MKMLGFDFAHSKLRASAAGRRIQNERRGLCSNIDVRQRAFAYNRAINAPRIIAPNSNTTNNTIASTIMFTSVIQAE